MAKPKLYLNLDVERRGDDPVHFQCGGETVDITKTIDDDVTEWKTTGVISKDLQKYLEKQAKQILKNMPK